MSDNLMSNDPSVASTNKYTAPDGLMFTSDFANSPNCLYVYVENKSAPFTFTLTKGSGVPVAFNSIQEVIYFMNSHAGTLIIFQDGTMDCNFDVAPGGASAPTYAP